MFEKYKRELLLIQATDYCSFIKALLSIEYSEIDEVKLYRCYKKYMDRDSMSLLNGQFDEWMLEKE